jgi:hypothetical protein
LILSREALGMTPENGKSFELFGLMVRVPNDEEPGEEFMSESVDERDDEHRPCKDDNSQYLDQIVSVQESFEGMVSDHPVDNRRTLVVLDCANIGWYVCIYVYIYICIYSSANK